jgi:tocopherol O-methyltransferase
MKYLAGKGGVPQGARVLDVGCGLGGSSVWLAENFGVSPVGITTSPVQVEMATAYAAKRGSGATFLLMDAEEMHFDEKFDVIWALGVCTHLESQQDFVKRASDFLNDNGRFILFDWMINGEVPDPAKDRYIKSVSQGMLLASLHTMPEYLQWFSDLGYRRIYSEDITVFTLKTWDDAIAYVRQPAVWGLAYRLARKEGKQVFSFVRSLSMMKAAMEKKRLVAAAVFAEKA